MLRDIFALVLKMSLSASWVILGVWVVRLFLKKAPKAYSYALWILVLVRLLCPVFPQTTFSPMPQKVASGAVVRDLVDSDIPVYVTPDVVEPDVRPEFTPPDTQSDTSYSAMPEPQEVKLTLAQVLTALWVAGGAAMVLYSVITLYLLKRRLRVSVHVRENIYCADYIESPFVIGVLRPRIYLPSSVPEAWTEHIILHEKCHIRCLDPLVKLLFYWALCLHWFNPLVWLAFFAMTRDMEMRCDEAVMKKMDSDARLDYAAALLSLASPRQRIAATPLAFGEGDPKRRIKNVLNYKKPVFWVSILAVLVLVLAGVFFLTNPIGEPEVNVAQLAYPGLAWNISPEEVLDVLEGSYDAISCEKALEPEGLRTAYYYEFSLEGCESFGLPTEKIHFSFVDTTGTGAYLGLYKVAVYYPDGENGVETDVSQVIDAVEAVYGKPADDFYENVYEESSGEVVGWREVPLDGEIFWNSEIKADTYYSDEDQALLYEKYAKENPERFLTEWEHSQLLDGRSMIRLHCFSDGKWPYDREKGETSLCLRFDAAYFVDKEQFLAFRKTMTDGAYVADKLLANGIALNWEPENGNWHGLIRYEKGELQVGDNQEFSSVYHGVHDKKWLLEKLTQDPLMMRESEAKKLLSAYPGENIEVRQYFASSDNETPQYTLVFFDGRLKWFAEKDFLRLYEVEKADIWPAVLPSGLEYPGLSWGMAPEDVKDALSLGKDLTESLIPADVSGMAYEKRIAVDGFDTFLGTANAVFSFKDHYHRGENYGLSSITLVFREDTVSRSELLQKLERQYGSCTSEGLWLPGFSAAESIDEKVLNLLYSHIGSEAPLSVYRLAADSFEEFADLLMQNYLVKVECKSQGANCLVTFEGEQVNYIQQWLNAED